MRYLTYFLVYLVLQTVAWVITPFLPLFAVRRECWNDNKSVWAPGWKLPKALAWFDTPDNSLDGDSAFLNRYIAFPRYWHHLCWLYRNSLYGFKWSVLSAPLHELAISGEWKELDYHAGKYGSFYLHTPEGFWQWKCVKPLGGRILVLNFGWLLEDRSQSRALFMCSPRIKKNG